MYQFVDDDLKTQTSNPNYDLHHLKLPLRAIIVAPSGSGKTNYLYYLISLFCQNQGSFSKIYIITSKGSSSQPIYDHLQRLFNGAITIREGLQHCPNIDEFDRSENSLVVFDDLMLTKHVDELCGQYFIRGRNKNISTIFISQSYFRIPRQSIRLNCNYIILLQLSSEKDMTMICQEYSGRVPREAIERMFEYATNEPMQAFVIDCENLKGKNPQHAFRRNLLEDLNPADFMDDSVRK
jgi:hypothetical protein